MLEFDEDDDFGDLYTDIEDTENRTLTKLQENCGASEENETDEEQNQAAAAAMEERRDWNGSGDRVGNVSETESESESEDDLNIVLNDNGEDNLDYNHKLYAVKIGGGVDDEDGNGGEEVDEENDEVENVGGGGGGKFGCYGGGYGAQLKHMRSHSAAFSNNMQSNGSAGLASYFSSARGNWENKSGSSLFGTSSIGTQSWHKFSLPRSRCILDINIDALEWKPWRHPGADITDFFNFGFDEDSWKYYCNHLDRCREKRTDVNGYAACKPWSYTKQHEVGSEHRLPSEAATEINTPSQLRITLSPCHESSPGEQQVEMPNGQAIEVKEGIGARQPSIGVRHPVDRDLDVIIQIPVQDIEEDLPNSAMGAVDESSSVVHEASDDSKESGDVTGNDGRDVLCFRSASEDELPSLDVSTEETQKSVPERCIKHTSECGCNPPCKDSEDCGSLKVSEADEHHYQEMSEDDSDGSSQATRSSDDPKNSVSFIRPFTAPCRQDLESSHAEQSQYSPRSSPSQSHDLASRNGAYVEADEFHGHLKRTSPSEVRECVTYDNHSSKDTRSRGIKMEPGDYEYFARSRSPIRRNDKFHRRKSSRMGELKSYLDYQGDSNISDLEKFQDLPHPTIGRFNQRNKHGDFHYSKREDFPYYEGSEQSFYHGGEKFCDYQSNDARARNSHRIGPLDSGYERDLPQRRIIDGKHRFPGQRIRRSKDDRVEQNVDQFESRLSVEEMDSLHYDGPRQFISKQSPFLESRNHTRRKCKPQELLSKRRRENNYIPECTYFNKYTRGNYRYIPNDKRERHVNEHKYDRLFLCARREVEIPVRSKRKFDNLLNVYETCRRADCEDKKVRYNGNQFSCLSHEEKRTIGRERWQGASLSRGEMFGRRGIQMRENFFERYNESKFGGCAGVFHNDEYRDHPDQDDLARRRLYLESEVLQCRENKYSSWHADSDSQGERRFHHFNRTSRSKRSDAKHGHGRKLIGHESERIRCNMLRKGNNGSQFLQNSNITHRYIGQTHAGSQNSADNHMVVGNRKSSRCLEGGSIICNDRYEYLDWNDHSDQRILKDLDEPHLKKIVRADNDRSNKFEDAAQFHKFPDAMRNDSSDIEEGQITTNDFDEPETKTCASKYTKSITGSKNLSSENPRILEMMAKMEKRRERFRQPLRNVSEKKGKPSADKVAETVESKKLERPVRKRKWVAS